MPDLTPLEAAEKKIARCNDCGMPYGGPAWVDTVLSNEQWNLIFPEHDGLLCANCIAKRAQKLGAISIFAKINFSGDYNKISAGEYRQVVHGRWLPIERIWKYSHQWTCSECGNPFLTGKYVYCPSCGALMGKDDSHEIN